MRLIDLQCDAWTIAEKQGLHDNLRPYPSREATMIRLALIHTEVSEATQLVKRHGVKGQEAHLAEELADIVIRVADLAQELGLSLEQAIQLKMQINRYRPYKYGTPEETEE